MKKILLVVTFLILLVLPSYTYANTDIGPQSESYFNSSRVASTYIESIFLGTVHTTSCLIIGASITREACFGDPNLQPGALGFIGSTLTTMFTNPPITSSQYIGNLSNIFIPTKTANAQVFGTGKLVIDTVFNLWQVSRNFSYLIMTIIFVVIGLMIMFRQKINPQTVISIQNALPGLVIGLILITLSYFFAALIVDISFIGIWVVSYFFFQVQAIAPNDITTAIGYIDNINQNDNALTLYSNFVNAGNNVNFGATIAPIIANITGTAKDVMMIMISVLSCQYATQTTGFAAQIPWIGGIATTITCAGAVTYANTNPAGAVGTLLFVVFLFILLFQMIQLLLRLLNNYLMILFLTFTAPFAFLAASLPGKQGIATTWVRNMLCNVLAFPAVFAVFYFAAYILGKNATTPFNVVNGMNVNFQTVPLLGSLDLELIRFLLVFGVLVATPAIPNVICEAIGKIGRPEQLIGQELQGGIRGGQGQLQQTISGFGTAGSAFSKTKWPTR